MLPFKKFYGHANQIPLFPHLSNQEPELYSYIKVVFL